MAEVVGIGAEQEIEAFAPKGIDQESTWNGASVIVHLHQPIFVNIPNLKFEDHSENPKLKLRISGVPDAQLLERIQQLLEMKGLGDAKVELVDDKAIKV